MDNLCPNNYNGGIEFETAAGENNKNGISKITSVATVTATDDGNMVDYTVIWTVFLILGDCIHNYGLEYIYLHKCLYTHIMNIEYSF